MNVCPSCNSKVDESFRFCPSCGYDLQIIKKEADPGNTKKADEKIVLCDNCGEETPAESGSCESCGALLTGIEKVIKEGSSEIPEETEKVITPKTKSVNESKPAPEKNFAKPKQQPVKQNKPKTAEVRNTPAAKQNVTPMQVTILVVGLVAVALLILEISGVFDAGSVPVVDEHVHDEQNAGTANPGVSLQQINEINALESEVKKDSTGNIERILTLAHLLNDSGFYDRAIGYYKMYLRRNPGNADAIIDMGVCYFNLKDYNTAKSVMRQGLKVKPDHQIAHFNLGIVNLSAGNPDSAKVWWQKAIDINPDTEIGKKAKELLTSH